MGRFHRIRQILSAIILICLGGYWAKTYYPQLFGHKNIQLTKSESNTAQQPAGINIEQKPSPLPTSLEHERLSDEEKSIIHNIQLYFTAGDYGKALSIAEKEWDISTRLGHSEAFQQWLLMQMPVLWTSAGWAKLKLGDCETALTLLNLAESFKKAPEITKGLAVCHYKLKNIPAAIEKFWAYSLQAPDDTEMLLLYADTLESDQRYQDAMRVLEHIILVKNTQIPPQPTVDDKNRLAQMQAKVKESVNQTTTNSRHFTLTYRPDEHSDVAAYALEVLEEALEEFSEQYAMKAPQGLLEVVLYPGESFHALSGGPQWADGLFDGRLRIPVARSGSTQRESLRRILRHELVHALYATMVDYRTIPSWFNEGVAQRLECLGSGACPSMRNQGFPETAGRFLTMRTLLQSFTSLDAASASQAYIQSLYLIGTLHHDRGEDVLRRIGQQLQSNSDLSSDGI